MKPPRNPLAGNRAGETIRKKARRGLFIPKTRMLRRPGDRARHAPDSSDAALRSVGLPIFDDAARSGELGDYLGRGRSR